MLADFPVALLPAAAFLLGALISFATGSSWGTFALLIPLLLPAAASLEGPVALTLAAILSGGLFEDHASPLSETTILAASGAELSTFEHFRHQWPYATVNGALALGAFLVAGAMPTLAPPAPASGPSRGVARAVSPDQGAPVTARQHR